MSPRMSDGHWGLRFVERVLLFSAVALLGWCAVVIVDATVVQTSESRQLDALLAEAERSPADRPSWTWGFRGNGNRGTTHGISSGEGIRAPMPDELLGRLEIPRLDVSAIVHEGIEYRTLQRAVGHVPNTALPGTVGNVGLAAHRDTYFRRLKDVRLGDEIILTTPEGRVRYRVRETLIVQPEDTWVLEPTPHASLTLVTCYPFQFIGTAPERFIVQADRVDVPVQSARNRQATTLVPPAATARASADRAIPPPRTSASTGVRPKAPVRLAAAGAKPLKLTSSRPAKNGKLRIGAREANRDSKAKTKPPRQKRGFWKRFLSAIT